MTRSILTPATVVDFGRAGGRSFWKQILPSKKVNYTAKGETRVLDFDDEEYLQSLILAHTEGAIGSTPFSLADADNKHTMDPERVRGAIGQLAKWEDVPEEVRAQYAGKYTEADLRGLWGKVEFPTDEAALAVLNNPALPVSARIREDVKNNVTGKQYRAALVHVLGTTDPKITGMAPWAETADLSEYAHDDVIDLSNESYAEADVSKSQGATTLDFATATIDEAKTHFEELTDEDVLEGAITADDIQAMSEEAVDAFVEKFGHLLPEGGDDNGGIIPDDTKEPQLSAEQQRTIDLANSNAQQAHERARAAEARVAAAEWRAERTGLEAAGVPPHVLDLAEPVLSRADDLVIDLSESGEDEIDASKIIRSLVDGYKGTVDLGIEHGSELDAEEEKRDDALLAQFEKDYPVG